MEKLGPLIPLAGLSDGVKCVEQAVDDDHVLVVSNKMVHLYNLDKAGIEHTWYADSGSSISSCVRSGDKVLVLVNKRTLVVADRDRNKLEDCVKLQMNNDISHVVSAEKSVWIIFVNGCVRQLEHYQTNDPEDWEQEEEVLESGVRLLSSVITQSSSGQLGVTHLMSQDNRVSVMRARLVLDTVTRIYTLTDTVTADLDLVRDDMVAWHLDPWSQLSLIKEDAIDRVDLETGKRTQLTKLPPGSKHTSLCHVSRDQLAVMGALSEGGYLLTISLTLRCVTGQAKLKTSSHTGKGLFLINGKLFVCVSNKVVSVTPNSGNLGSVIGSQATPASIIKDPQLNDNFLKMADMPEYLIIDCIIKLLNSGDYTEERQLEVLSILTEHQFSQSVMTQLVTEKLHLNHVIRLLRLLEMLLSSESTVNIDNILSWVNILVTCHYLHLVMTQDEEASSVRELLLDTVKRIQKTVKALADCKISVENLMKTNSHPVKANNQAYSIEIIQI